MQNCLNINRAEYKPWKRKSACESVWQERTWLHNAQFPDAVKGDVGKIGVKLKSKAEAMD